MKLDTEAILREARSAFSPEEHDRTRVWQRIQAGLRAVRSPQGAADANAPASASRSWTPASWKVNVLGGVAIALAAGGGGFWLGRHTPAPTTAPTPAASTRATAEDPQARVREEQEDREVRQRGEKNPSKIALAQPIEPFVPPLSPSRRTREPPIRSGRGDAAAKSSSPDALDTEVHYLRGIERALRDEQPQLALALLRELDNAVPKGRLIEERQATNAIARCFSDSVPFGVDLADDFREVYPQSIYLKRVEQACTSAQQERPKHR